MKVDISNRTDIYKIVSLFYDKLFANELMAPFFEDFMELASLENHLQTLVDFWDGILFDAGTYRKNAIQPHVEKHEKMPFTAAHFEKWIALFSEAIDEQFSGQVAEVAKSRAQSIATVMQIKILH